MELEPMERRSLSALIKEKSARSGVIVTDHAYRDVLAVADRISILKDGRLHHLSDARSELRGFGYLPR